MNTFEVAEEMLIDHKKDVETNIYEDRTSQISHCTLLHMLLVMILQEILRLFDRKCEDRTFRAFFQLCRTTSCLLFPS